MIRINLLKPEKKEIREEPLGIAPEIKEKKKTPVASLLILLAIGAVAVLYFLQDKAIKTETELLNAAQAEKQKLQYVLSALEKLEAQKSTLERKINLINLLKSRQEIAVRTMDELSKNRTSIIIAHRLSTVKHVDTIFVLRQGNIIETGTHDNLIQENGYYYMLYSMNLL